MYFGILHNFFVLANISVVDLYLLWMGELPLWEGFKRHLLRLASFGPLQYGTAGTLPVAPRIKLPTHSVYHGSPTPSILLAGDTQRLQLRLCEELKLEITVALKTARW